ncbi:MAG: hypothetical protein IJ809_04665 [Clostridia bacterium]|nr:hypothetical protein [Clostridia bacterium]
MGINYSKRLPISTQKVKKCESCKKVFSEDANFCSACGKKLMTEKLSVYANIGKNGISSFSYKLPNGTTINSKGNITLKLAKGISYTTNSKPKKKNTKSNDKN